ncbi:MAG TPA: phosphotyrosine protein phosphatase [Candidatus Nanoarchaeia archaeon]|nr:phosphotyrosine protein phosphatase [Candidatus Nanoarchaeia archaeon]
MNALFICNQNQNHSKLAEEIFKEKFSTKSAGLFNQKPLTEKELDWAEVVFVMEDFQRSEIAKRFPKLYMQKRILSLDVPDEYNYKDTSLAKILKSRMRKFSKLL